MWHTFQLAFEGKWHTFRLARAIIQIYYENLKIAEHIRLYDHKGRYSTIITHMPDKHLGMSKDRLIDWGNKIDISVGDFLAKYFAKIPIEEQGYKGAQGIIDLSRKNLPRLITAVKEAEEYGVYTYAAIKAIYTRLEKQMTFEELVNNSNLRGPDYYKENKN